VDDPLAIGELALALEHVEAVGVVFVDVRLDDEPRSEAKVDDLELGQLGEDAMKPLAAR